MATKKSEKKSSTKAKSKRSAKPVKPTAQVIPPAITLDQLKQQRREAAAQDLRNQLEEMVSFDAGKQAVDALLDAAARPIGEGEDRLTLLSNALVSLTTTEKPVEQVPYTVEDFLNDIEEIEHLSLHYSDPAFTKREMPRLELFNAASSKSLRMDEFINSRVVPVLSTLEGFDIDLIGYTGQEVAIPQTVRDIRLYQSAIINLTRKIEDIYDERLGKGKKPKFKSIRVSIR